MNYVYLASALFFIKPIYHVCTGTWSIMSSVIHDRAAQQDALQEWMIQTDIQCKMNKAQLLIQQCALQPQTPLMVMAIRDLTQVMEQIHDAIQCGHLKQLTSYHVIFQLRYDDVIKIISITAASNASLLN